MSFFLFLAALYVTPWMLGFAGWYVVQPYRDIMFYLPTQHLFLIGPIIFFYVSSLLNPKFRVIGTQWLHFVPAAIYIVFCAVIVVYDKIIVGDYFFLESQEDPEFDSWYQIAGCLSLAVYYVSTLRYYHRYRMTLEAVISNAGNFLFNWVRNFLIALLVILGSWQILLGVGIFYQLPFDVSWWYFLSFAICCYYIAIAGYSKSAERRVFFSSAFISSNRVQYISPPKHAADESVVFEEIQINDIPPVLYEDMDSELRNWKARIDQVIADEKLYQRPDFNLFELARALSTNASLLSKMINQGFGCNFNDLVNGYRVEMFIELVRQGKHKKHTLLSLATESGFNSKTTFNRAFRKKMGSTPQDYVRAKGL